MPAHTAEAPARVFTPDWAGLGRAALELWVILWMYGGYAWLTNGVDCARGLDCGYAIP
jgi:hypothetical protein